ncbi:MAG TPA: S1/P1 nuclease [Xanthomonadales bacterium]|nr:S1/P1 nuclease [Xanthomonadales bacterium]
MKYLSFILTALVLAAFSTPARPWGPAGHSAIGRGAVAQLDQGARGEVMAILGAGSEEALHEAIAKACFWPDTVRESSQWSWSSPQHYVNIPRTDGRYDRQRDCPDGLCVTEAIPKYAAQLDRPGPDSERRWQAFAWLCHLVGDVHQPLHAGFRDDRGGNQVEIEYLGEQSNLHRFWDSLLASERLGETGRLPAIDEPPLRAAAAGKWDPRDVIAWTEESHSLAGDRAYPPGPVIDEAFADASWELVQQQWLKASARLAAILSAVLAADDGGKR